MHDARVMQGPFGGTLAGGSDVLGIAIVLAVALNLMNLKHDSQGQVGSTPPRRAPCDNNSPAERQLARGAGAVISSTEKEHV